MRKYLKILSLGLIAALTLGIFAGCGNDSYALTANGEEYPVGPYAFYAYWYRDLWATNLYLYTGSADINSKLDLTATEDGQTLEQMIVSQTEDQYIAYILLNKEFERLGLEFSEEIQSDIDYVFEETFINSYTDEELQNIYDTLGLTQDDIKDILSVNYKRQMIVDYYFGEGGAQEITEDEIKDTFTNDYARFKYIALSKYDDDGNSLSTAEILEKYDLANSLMDQLNNGADFVQLIRDNSEAYITDEQMAELSSDTEIESAESLNKTLTEDGLIIGTDGTILQDYASGVTSTLDSTLVNAVFNLENNQYTMVETDIGYWIVQRCDINEDEDLYNNCRDIIFNILVTEPYNELFGNWKTDFNYVMNDSVVEKYNPRNISALFFNEDDLAAGVDSLENLEGLTDDIESDTNSDTE